MSPFYWVKSTPSTNKHDTDRVETEHCVAHELPKLKICIAPLSSKQKRNKSADEDKANEAEAQSPVCKLKRKWGHKLISHVVHSHVNDPFGPVGIVTFSGSLLEMFVCE